MHVEFCLPIYNEEKIMAKNTEALLSYCRQQNFAFSWRIILIINGSNDGSSAISRRLEAQSPDTIHAVVYAEPGKGRAIKEYFLRSEADIVLYMDIDMAASLDNIKDLLGPIIADEADLVIGSRMMPDSTIKRSFIREFSSQTYNLISRMILDHHFSDLQCGFKAMRKKCFHEIANNIENSKWFFDTELVSYSLRQGHRIKEVPINWSENRWDERKSKINLAKDSFIFIGNLFKLKRKLGQTRKKEKIAGQPA